MKDQEQLHDQITKLISLGKEQNYLTYAQMADIMPDIADSDDFDLVVSMLASLDIRVYEQPPSEDQLALDRNTKEISEDDEEASEVLKSLNKPSFRN